MVRGSGEGGVVRGSGEGGVVRGSIVAYCDCVLTQDTTNCSTAILDGKCGAIGFVST